MKFDLSTVNREEFNVTPHIIAGDECFLVCPKNITAHWTKDNLWQRSVVVTKDGEPVSLGFPKFFNWMEHPEIHPVPTSMDNCEAIEKLDGSLLAVSSYKGQVIARTRGTVDATKMDNGFEIERFRIKYPKVFNFRLLGNEYLESVTYLYEWISPNNIIVINYGLEPRLYLIGAIFHHDYSLMSQERLDREAEFLGVERPRRFSFNTVEEMVAGVEAFNHIEGVVVYYNNGQTLKKLKGLEYLARHRFKEHATLENTLDLYFAYGQPDYQTFMGKLAATFDHECANMVLSYASQICDAAKEVGLILFAMDDKVKTLQNLPRKDAAAVILQAYGNTNRAGFAFKKLDNRALTNEDLVKLFYQVMKK